MSLFKNRIAIGSICIVSSVVICFIITPMFNKNLSKKVKVITVAKDIEQGEKITEDKIDIIEVGAYNLPKTILHKKEEAINKYATTDMLVDDYLLEKKVSDTPSENNAYLYNLGSERQAISISIKNFADGLSGKLKAGDIVSVIVPNFREQVGSVIPNELKYVKVIGVTTESGIDANTGKETTNTEGEEELPSTVTLMVNEEQSKLIAEIEQNAKAHLSLIYRGTESKAEEFINIQDKILDIIKSGVNLEGLDLEKILEKQAKTE